VARLFPSFLANPDYASIINPRQEARLEGLLKDAVAQGARVQHLGGDESGAGESSSNADGQMTPTLVFDVQPGMQLMQEEIFGPILPVVPYDSLEEAIHLINARPRPLALYWFGTDVAARERVLKNTVSGGVCINDTLMHVAHDQLPFGGVGDSGWGAYHGDAGFDRLTQSKPVLVSSRWFRGDLFYPPYGPRFDRVLGLVKRLF
jgi:coniferyl-aldehyde dehydrogenase